MLACAAVAVRGCRFQTLGTLRLQVRSRLKWRPLPRLAPQALLALELSTLVRLAVSTPGPTKGGSRSQFLTEYASQWSPQRTLCRRVQGVQARMALLQVHRLVGGGWVVSPWW